MKQKQTKKEALNTCKNYQPIIGKLYLTKDNGVEVVEAICIVPFDKKNKAIFIERYKIYRNPDKAISFYDGGDYTVMVITTCATGICCRELDKFINGEGILQHG